MSNVSDAFSGASSGTTDASGSSGFGDTPNLTDSTFSGLTDANITGNASDAGGGGFNSLSSIVNALSGGGTGSTGTSSVGAQSAAMTPPSAAATTGGDPTGAAGGTQSATTPGSAPSSPQGGGQTQQQQQQNDQHAPQSAVDQLKALLKSLSGKPTGPTGQIPLPSVAPGQTGAQSPPPLPRLAALETGAQSPPTMPLPSVTPGETGKPNLARVDPGYGGIGADVNAEPLTKPMTGQQPLGTGEPQLDDDGNPITAGGTRADKTPLPPPRPGEAQPTVSGKPLPKTDDQGRTITVKKPGDDADLPTKTPLPTKKPGPEPAPAANVPQPSRLIQDITGTSTGVPTALPELARMAMALAPLIGMFMGGGGRRGGHFHGGRFTHGVPGGFNGFRGGQRAMGGGAHPPSRGPWPYHHPMHGWDMHHMHPGGGWRPLNPRDAHQLGLFGGGAFGGVPPGQDPNAPNQQDPNARDPNNPPPEGARDSGPGKASGQVGGEASPDDILATIRQRESGDYSKAPWEGHDASGAYQIKPKTWAAWARDSGDTEAQKYGAAYQAPAAVQDRMARWALMKYGPNATYTWAASGPELGKPYPSPTGGTLAQQTPKPELPWVSSAPPVTLPLTSQPMVIG